MLRPILSVIVPCALATLGSGKPVDAPADSPSVDRCRQWVEERIEAWQPTPAERAFDRIGWAPTLRDALRLGKQHGRPIFLFTYDGESMACYRC